MNKDLKDIAGQFKNSFKDLINTGDTRGLKRDVAGTVNSALDIAFEEVRKAVSSIQSEILPNMGKSASQPHQYGQSEGNTRQASPAVRFPHKPVGRAGSVLYTVFGWVGLVGLGIAAAFTATFSAFNTMIAVALSAFFAFSVSLQVKGSAMRGRLRRFKRYLALLEGRTSCTIKELSVYSGLSERFILRDFQKMISLGMFPQAHIDDEKTLVMLNNEVYERYLAQQAEYRAQRERELWEKEAEKKKPASAAGPDIRNAVEEGKKYIQQISEAKQAISNSVVSAKVQRLEGTIGKIIGHIEDHPEKLPEVRRFMAYYLPTTVKLLDAYREFDRQPIQGENITTAKKEINDALDTINTAFENLFDSLFENAAWSVSADINVLNTMLKQEGLAEKDFKPRS